MLPNNLFAFVKLWEDYWKPIETVYNPLGRST